MTVSGNTISTSYLPAGTFKVSVHSNSYGYAVVEPATVIVAFPSNPTASAITSSFAGGKALTINGAGFVTNDPKNNEISVCGLRAKVVSAS